MMFSLRATFVVLLIGQALTQDSQEKKDHVLTTPELVEKDGYPVETHFVTTEDGYILQLHRIPHGKGSDSTGKDVVLLQHGLLCSSADWVVTGPDHGFAYQLADEGYDVWLGNARGNVYSRNHTSISPDDKEFWNFSWHELGIYDLPAMIDKILDETKQENLFYIGHSMGTTMFFVMGSIKTEYNSKIRAMFAFAPVAIMTHTKSPFVKLLAPFVFEAEWIAEFIGLYEFFPSSELLHNLADVICKDGAILQSICSDVLFLIAGFDEKQLNKTLLPDIIDHTPAGASTKELVHYGQLVNSGGFHMYDHGEDQNLEIYGKRIPPEYDMDKLSCPVIFNYGENDWLASLDDVLEFSKRIPNLVMKLDVPHRDWSHLDFLWATDVRTLLYNKVLGIMSRF